MTRVENPIGPRLIRNIILISTFFSIFATAIQLYSDYKSETSLMNIRLDQIKSSSLDSLTLNLWQNNDKHIDIQLKSLLSFPDVTFISIEEDGVASYLYGEDKGNDSIEKRYELLYLYNNKEYKLGTLKLQSGLDQIRNRLKDRFYLIALSQTIKTFIVAFIILYLFSYMVTRHLNSIANYILEISVQHSLPDLVLEKKIQNDELSLLCDALNQLRHTIEDKLSESEKSKNELGHINALLKKRISLHEEENITKPVLKADIQEIEKMMKFITEEELARADLELIKKDISALNILLKRAFKKN